MSTAVVNMTDVSAVRAQVEYEGDNLTTMTSIIAEPQVRAGDAPAKYTPAKVVRPEEGEIVEAFGDRMRLLLTSEDTHGEIALGLDETLPGNGPPLHVHASEDEIWIIQSGRYEFQIVDERVEVGPGTVVFGPRDVPHTFRVLSDAPARQYILALPGGFDHFFKRSAKEFATGAPDVAKIFQIGAEHGITFLTPESLAGYRQSEAETPIKPKVVRSDEGLIVDTPHERGRGILLSEDTGGRVLLAETEVQPGSGPPLHVHTREDEVFFVQSGEFEFQIGDRRVQAGPGTVVYGPRHIPHRFRATGEAPGRMLVLVTPGALQGYFLRAAELMNRGTDERALADLAAEYGMTFLSPQS